VRRDAEMTTGYTEEHSRGGLDASLPRLDTVPNHFPSYTVEIVHPEFTSICPKTGLPDFATLVIRYGPRERLVELKALKLYLNGYRNLGIFQENVVNRVLEDLVAAVEPEWAEVEGRFRARGGLSSRIHARWPRTAP